MTITPNRPKSVAHIICVALVCSTTLLPVHANESRELENLAALSEELTHLIGLTKQAWITVPAPNHARVQFNYAVLLGRLTAIQNDIGKHIRYVQANPKWERLDIE